MIYHFTDGVIKAHLQKNTFIRNLYTLAVVYSE